MSINVFVHGTLRSGEINDLTQLAARHSLPAPRLIDPGRVPGHLVDFGDWPGLVPTQDGRFVTGDIYQADPRLPPLLDEVEEISPEENACFLHAEVRAETALGPVLCQYYPINPGAAPGARGIPADDWVSYRVARDAAALGSLEALAASGGRPGPITVSTLKEADRFHAAGFDDILYAVGTAPARRSGLRPGLQPPGAAHTGAAHDRRQPGARRAQFRPCAGHRPGRRLSRGLAAAHPAQPCLRDDRAARALPPRAARQRPCRRHLSTLWRLVTQTVKCCQLTA